MNNFDLIAIIDAISSSVLEEIANSEMSFYDGAVRAGVRRAIINYSRATSSNDTLQGRGEADRDAALQAIIDRIAPGCSSSALAALGALSDIEVIARAALQKDTRHDG